MKDSWPTIRNGRTAPAGRPAFVLISVLVVVVLLSLAAYQYSELMAAEYRAAESGIRTSQARSLAISGVHFAAAALADRETFVGRLNGNVYDNADAFRGITVAPHDAPRMRGRFSLVAPPPVDDAINGNTNLRFGLVDESGKINLNALVSLGSGDPKAVLLKLPNMTDEIADAILDWIDADDETRANGAENQYYTSLSPGYRCKNGPLDSIEELLLVRGVTRELLFGTDRNRNGRPDADETGDNGFDPGWSAYLTVYSRELNRDSDTQPRIYLNDSDKEGLYDQLKTALGEELATWIMAYRLYGGASTGSGSTGNTIVGGKLSKDMLDFQRRGSSISSIFSLIDGQVSLSGSSAGGSSSAVLVTAISITNGGSSSLSITTTTTTSPSPSPTQTTGGSRTGGGSSGGGSTGGGGGSNTPSVVYPSPLNDPAKRKQLLPLLLDKCTTRKDAELPARVNVNTASRAVLYCLPGLEESDIQAILDARPNPNDSLNTDPLYTTPAWLLTEANISTSKLRTLERYITARSQTYRVQALGYFDEGGPVARVEAVIDTNGGQPRVIYFRDLTELGRGYEVPR